MKTARMVAIAGVLLASIGAASTEEGHDGKTDTKTGTITGTVIDIPCYIMKHGHGHSACAIDQNLPVGLVDEKGHVWVAITDKFSSANELLAPLMGRKVRAEGWYVESDQISLIAISRVTALKAGGEKTKK